MSHNESNRPMSVEYCYKKWSPLVKNLDGRAAQFTAWTMEQETAFLRTEHDAMRGSLLKVIFPLLSRVAPSYVSGIVPELSTIVQHFEEEALNIVYAIIENDVACGRLTSRDTNFDELKSYIPGMAERLQGSIKSFAEATR